MSEFYPDDSYGYGYGYGYGGGAVAPRGQTRGWAGGYSPAVSGYSINPDACTCAGGVFNGSDCCALAKAALCAIDSVWCSASCDSIQQQIQSNCSIFVAGPGGQPDPARVCAQCVNGVWTGSCPKPAGVTCTTGGGGCTCPDNTPCPGGVASNCATGGGGSNLLLLAAVGGAVALAALFALAGPARKTITVSG